ncbi:hypothetical protein PROFUN_16852, partial [Planoprotostelium fungivorum]
MTTTTDASAEKAQENNQETPAVVACSLIRGEQAPFRTREGHCLVSDGSNHVFLFGGGASSLTGPQQYDDLHLYSVADNKWKPLSGENGPGPRTGAASALVTDRLFIFGGFDIEKAWLRGVHVYDIKTDNWSRPETALTGGPTPRDKFSAVVHGKDIYLFGGFGPQSLLNATPTEDEDNDDDDDENEERGPAVNFTWFNDTYKLDTDTMTWSVVQTAGDLPTPRAAFGMTLIEDKIFIVGGKDSLARLNDVYALDIPSLTWYRIEVTGMPPPARSFHSCVRIPETKALLIEGGIDVQNSHLNDAFVLDTEKREWKKVTLKDQPSPRGNHGGVVVGNDFMIFGGSSSYNASFQE